MYFCILIRGIWSSSKNIETKTKWANGRHFMDILKCIFFNKIYFFLDKKNRWCLLPSVHTTRSFNELSPYERQLTTQCVIRFWTSSVTPYGAIRPHHYNDVTMSAMESQITSLTIAYSTVYSGADQRKHQSSASLAFVRGIHRWPVNSPHKGPVTRKMFPFDDVIMLS